MLVEIIQYAHDEAMARNASESVVLDTQPYEILQLIIVVILLSK